MTMTMMMNSVPILSLVLMTATLISLSNCNGKEEELSHLGLGFIRGRKVGGRSRVRDVEANEEVQALGRFSVEQHNKNVLIKNDPAATTTREEEVLEFRRVVEAERQVVSGIKYYLRIEAARSGGDHFIRVFDAVVVVKPWVHPSRQLLHFSPSSSSSVVLTRSLTH